MGAGRVLIVLFLVGAIGSHVHAQAIIVGGAVHGNLQRFDGDPTLNRLDGHSPGWSAFGAGWFRAWFVQAELSRDGTIRNRENTALVVNSRPITIHSELVHDMRSVAIVGGHSWDLSTRLQLSAGAGVSVVTVHRLFTSDAGELILVRPSAVPTTPVVTTYVDQFAVWTAEGNVAFRLIDRLALIAGVRMHPIRLREDVSGWSVSTFGGAVWRLK